MDKPSNNECPWCNESLDHTEQFIVERDGDYMHMSCAAEEDDDSTFDSDMGFGS